MDINIFEGLQGAIILWIVLILAGADLILGFLSAFQTHSFKSSINKKGVLQKIGCVTAIAFMYILDTEMGLSSIGFSTLFGSTLCVSELVSILANCQSLGMPLPESFGKLLEKYTNEKK